MDLSGHYYSDSPSPPVGLSIPEHFRYIHYKAYNYLQLGPDVYRHNDFFNMPQEDVSTEDLEDLNHGCRQIVEWRGIDPSLPIDNLGIIGFNRLIELFHFETVSQTAIYNDDGSILDKITIKHKISEKEIILYNKVD